MTAPAVPAMRASGDGHVVVIGSVIGAVVASFTCRLDRATNVIPLGIVGGVVTGFVLFASMVIHERAWR